MRETSKCLQMRLDRGDFDVYLRGLGLDIGCGDDPLAVPQGQVGGWDIGNGDAMTLLGEPSEKYDFVYSSHCLEHLADVAEALSNWTRVLKPMGWLYLVVPDYELYEKCSWPSRFNGDHKHSFSLRLTREVVGRSNHYHISDLIRILYHLGVNVRCFQLEHQSYDWNRGHIDQTLEDALSQICIVAQRL